MPRAIYRRLCLVAALAWFCCAGFQAGADQTYIVKRGDTLHGVAKKQGVSVGRLAERNGLTKSAYLYTGQRLIIPSPAKPAATRSSETASAVALPAPVQRAISRAPVRSGRWKYIVIHHSGVYTGSAKGMDQYHREKRHMENGLAYHFVIGNGNGMRDGQISVGRRWLNQLDGGHLASERQNQYSIGICLVGNFDRQQPTTRQMQALRALVKALIARCALPASAVKTHQEINVIGTRCPGSKFPSKSFKDSLR
jgi:LysM repeat protein